MKVLNNHDFKLISVSSCKGRTFSGIQIHKLRILFERAKHIFIYRFIHTHTIKQMQPATHLFVGTHFSQSRYWHRIIRTHSQTMTAVAPVSMLIKINCTIYLIQYSTHNVHVFAHRNELATVSTAIFPDIVETGMAPFENRSYSLRIELYICRRYTIWPDKAMRRRTIAVDRKGKREGKGG